MAFGFGVLISTLAFELMAEARDEAGVLAAVAGFVLGGGIYAGANALLAGAGARHRKRANRGRPAAVGTGASASASLAIAVGYLLDGVPESAAIGISLLDGEGVALVTMMAIFLSKVPEGLSSSIGMKKAGHSARYVFGIWGLIAATCNLSALLGFLVIGDLGPFYVGLAVPAAAGAIFVMLIDTMTPEAFEEIHNWSDPHRRHPVRFGLRHRSCRNLRQSVVGCRSGTPALWMERSAQRVESQSPHPDRGQYANAPDRACGD